MGLFIKNTETTIIMPSGQSFYERKFTRQNGLLCLSLISVILIIAVGYGFDLFFDGIKTPSLKKIWFALFFMTIACFCTILLSRGLKIIKPNEGTIFLLFGKYYVTITEPGFYFVNPFANEEGIRQKFGAASLGGLIGSFKGGYGNSGNRIPLSPIVFELTLNNVLNTKKGYVLSMATKIEYRIANPTKALFSVDNFGQYLEETCECLLRNIIHQKIFYGDSQPEKINVAVSEIVKEISTEAKERLQEALSNIGIEVLSISIKEVYDKREQHFLSINEY